MTLEKITEKTERWKQQLDIALPINDSDLINFNKWVNWNGYTKQHIGFDFCAYLDKYNRCILGLSSKTPIRAIASGIVKQISQGLVEGFGYATFINIEHGRKGGGLFSSYHHIISLVEHNQPVKKGEIIATLYGDKKDEGRFVHLHFEMTNGWNIKNRRVDPSTIFPLLSKFKAEPQGSKYFYIHGLERQPKRIILGTNNFYKQEEELSKE